MRVGVDIGGTNTDAVWVDEKERICHRIKVPTTQSIEEGVVHALSHFNPHQVTRLTIGSTHAINAVLQCRGLYKVGVIRLSGNRPEMLQPGRTLPKKIREEIVVGSFTVGGGFECQGHEITKLSPDEVIKAAEVLSQQGAESLAIVGAFAPLYPEQELQCLEILSNYRVSLSHQIGGMGLIERENTTIINAALKKVMTTGFSEIFHSVRSLGYLCPIFISQNNGSVMTLDEALLQPVLTLSSGPTNSFVGGGKLARLSDAIIIDIGGTSTDVGIINQGFPRKSLQNCVIGGVVLNFSSPDLLSVAIGGGSHIEEGKIGPDSSAKNLLNEGVSFGGEQLTMTDLAIAMGHLRIPHKRKAELNREMCEEVLRKAVDEIDKLVKRMEPQRLDLPVILVGGGAGLIPKELLPLRYLIPDHADVANAYGAALGETAGVIDKIVCLQKRETILEELREEVLGKAGSGARIVEVEITPYHYMPGELARVRMMAVK